MKSFIQVVGWSWIAFCVILDILIYKKSRSWRIRAIPAVIKLLFAGLLILIHFLLPDPPMLEPDVPTLPMIAILFGIGVLIDVWAWLFSDGYPSKRKMWIYGGGIAIFMVVTVVCGLVFDNQSYRHTSSGRMHHYSFHAYTGQCSETLKLYEDEPECRFNYDAEEGTLELLVRDESGSILYSGTPEDPSEFTVIATGTIEITITTEDFTGILHADRIESDGR